MMNDHILNPTSIQELLNALPPKSVQKMTLMAGDSSELFKRLGKALEPAQTNSELPSASWGFNIEGMSFNLAELTNDELVQFFRHVAVVGDGELVLPTRAFFELLIAEIDVEILTFKGAFDQEIKLEERDVDEYGNQSKVEFMKNRLEDKGSVDYRYFFVQE